jgi:hypothetical protein
MNHKAKGPDAPYGYRVDDDGVHLVPVELEQQVISCVRELRAAGLSHQEIYSELEKRGLAVKSFGPDPAGAVP